MVNIIRHLLTLFALILITGTVSGQEYDEEMFMERRLSVDGRKMAHLPVHTTPLYGNSTGLYYFYVTMLFGSFKQP